VTKVKPLSLTGGGKEKTADLRAGEKRSTTAKASSRERRKTASPEGNAAIKCQEERGKSFLTRLRKKAEMFGVVTNPSAKKKQRPAKENRPKTQSKNDFNCITKGRNPCNQGRGRAAKRERGTSKCRPQGAPLVPQQSLLERKEGKFPYCLRGRIRLLGAVARRVTFR